MPQLWPAPPCGAQASWSPREQKGAHEGPGHRRRRVHRLDAEPAPARAGGRGPRGRQSQRLLRRASEAGAPRPPDAVAPFSPFPPRHRRSRGRRRPVRERAARARDQPRCSGRGALLARESPRLRRRQHRRLPEHPRGLPPSAGRAPRLRVHELGVRCEHQPAIQRARRRGSPALALRGDEARQRADGTLLQSPVRTTRNGPALLHRLRPVGPSGHGAVPVHAEHRRGQADRRVQLRAASARFHLRGRHRRGGGPRAGQARDARSRLAQRRTGHGQQLGASSPLQHRQQRLGRARALHRRPRGLPRRRAERNLLPLQPGDVPDTYADVDDLVRDFDYGPSTSVEVGIARFVEWYKHYYGVN